MSWNDLYIKEKPTKPVPIKGIEEMFTVKELMALTKQGMTTIYRLMEPWNVRKTSDIGGSTRFTAETVRQLTT